MRPATEIDDAIIATERDVLGIILGRPDAVDDCDELDPSDFLIPEHGIIFREVSEATRAGRGISPNLIAASVGSNPIAGVSPGLYLLRLMADASTIVNLPTSVRSVRDAADRRRIVDASKIAIKRADAASWSENPAAIASEAIAALDGIASSRSSRGTRRVSIRDAADDALTSMNDRRQSGKSLVGCTWGLRDMDEATLGLIRGDMIILAGRPSSGKSCIASSVAISAARAGAGVYFVSLEMTGEQLALRALTDIAWNSDRPIAYADANRGMIDDRDYERLMIAQEKLSDLPVIIEQQPGLTVSQIATRARRLARDMEAAGKRLDVLIIDHMGLVKPSGRYSGNKVAEVGEVSNALKPLAKELDVAVLALCQMSRASEARDDKRPQLSDLRWAGEIEQDADVVVGVYREAYYLERKGERTPEEEARLDATRNALELLILKQRMGPTKTVTAFCDVKANAVRDMARWR